MPDQTGNRMLGPPQQGGMQGGGLPPFLMQLLQQYMQMQQMQRGMQGGGQGGMHARGRRQPDPYEWQQQHQQPRGAGWYPDVTRPGYFTPNQSGQPVAQPSFSPGPPGGQWPGNSGGNAMPSQPGWMPGPNQPSGGGGMQPGSWLNSLFGMLGGGGGMQQQPGYMPGPNQGGGMRQQRGY
jgi:hypothetical protein